MRGLVLVLVGLALLKIWTNDQIYRSATEDALINAYRSRAVDACQKERRKDVRNPTPAISWANASTFHIIMGKRDVDVAIWDVDNPLWAVRYKYPLLVLKSGPQQDDLSCEYDITLERAVVMKSRT
jgi:hypothetical protein